MSTRATVTPNDLREALALGDVLDRFEHLPEDARQRFQAWIDKGHDETAHWRRIDLLVMAMRSAPRLLGQSDPAPASTSSDR